MITFKIFTGFLSNKVFNRFYYKSLIISQKKNKSKTIKVKETTYFSSAQLTKYIRTKASYKIIDNIYKTYIIHYNVLINKNEKKNTKYSTKRKPNSISSCFLLCSQNYTKSKRKKNRFELKNTNFENKSLLRVVFFYS